MLTIKKCATLLSMYQDGSDTPHCGRNCLGSCCISGTKLPAYTYNKDIDFGNDEIDDGRGNFFESLLLAEWEDRMSRGLFRYDVTACETKVLPGKLGFIAQLNEGRHLKKRPTEFRVDQVLQPFDPEKFNFTKVGREEVLFCFEENKGETGPYQYHEKISCDNPNIIAINVSPIEYGHVLLIPKVSECKPQQIDQESFRLAVHMAVEANNPYFRVGYNSLGAFATINHLHFQAYYLAIPFPVERASTKLLKKKEDIKICELVEYPVKGLVFECGRAVEQLADLVSNTCISFHEQHIPFNVLIADCGRRIFVFPQCFAKKQALGLVSQEKLDTQVNPAVWEISGHIVLKRRQDFEDASEEKAWNLLAEVSLSDDCFQEVKKLCLTQNPSVLIKSDATKLPSFQDETSGKRNDLLKINSNNLMKECAV